MSSVVNEVIEPEAGTSTGGRRFLRRFSQQRGPLVALGLLVLVVLAAAFASVLAPADPNASDLSRRFDSPSRSHLLGTDDIGRDVLSRVLFAARLSLLASAQAVLVAMVVGIPAGLIGGYFGGWADSIVMRLNDTLMSFPPLILAITIIGFLGPNLTNAMLAIGLVFAPRFARIVRGATLAVREETYIEASLSIGCSTGRILRRHVLPNILPPLIVETTIALGLGILSEASLSFLGLGAQPPEASLGSMLRRSFAYLDQAPVYVLAPGITIAVIVLALNLVGDGLNDALGREIRSVR